MWKYKNHIQGVAVAALSNPCVAVVAAFSTYYPALSRAWVAVVVAP